MCSMFDERARLKSALGSYAVHRACGPVVARFEATTWNQYMSVLGSFYRWAVETVGGGGAVRAGRAVRFYKQALAVYGDQVRAADLAHLTDRVAMHAGQPQLYGTQLCRDPHCHLTPYRTCRPRTRRPAAGGAQPVPAGQLRRRLDAAAVNGRNGSRTLGRGVKLDR